MNLLGCRAARLLSDSIFSRLFSLSAIMNGGGRPTAGIIIIGDEILKGQTLDTNTHFLAKNLKSIGIGLERVVVIPDDIDIIAKEVKTFSDKYTYVLTSGGVGPTHDDVTFEGVAKAFDDETFLHPEMEQLIKDYFQDVNEATLKLGQIPTTATLNYPSKIHPGQIRYPLVSVKNVYIFPGIPTLLQRAFMRMKDDLFKSQYKSHVRECFVTLTEVQFAETLNTFVKNYPGAIFGSYPNWSNNYYSTKITIESDNVSEVEEILLEFKGRLPTIDFEKDPQENSMDKIKSLIENTKDEEFNRNVQTSMSVLEECYKQFGPDQVSVAFNGGKDNIVMIHLVHSFIQKNFADHKRKIQALYIKEADPFPEVEEFIRDSMEANNIDLVTINGPMKEALSQFLGAKPGIKAMVLGTRSSDPKSAGQGHFAATDGDWPKLMRVNPILHWTYDHVWKFIRGLSLPYPLLYDKGFTSLGSRSNTQPNPNLAFKDDKGHVHYKPAYELHDSSKERAGRIAKSNV